MGNGHEVSRRSVLASVVASPFAGLSNQPTPTAPTPTAPKGQAPQEKALTVNRSLLDGERTKVLLSPPEGEIFTGLQFVPFITADEQAGGRYMFAVEVTSQTGDTQTAVFSFEEMVIAGESKGNLRAISAINHALDAPDESGQLYHPRPGGYGLRSLTPSDLVVTCEAAGDLFVVRATCSSVNELSGETYSSDLKVDLATPNPRLIKLISGFDNGDVNIGEDGRRISEFPLSSISHAGNASIAILVTEAKVTDVNSPTLESSDGITIGVDREFGANIKEVTTIGHRGEEVKERILLVQPNATDVAFFTADPEAIHDYIPDQDGIAADFVSGYHDPSEGFLDAVFPMAISIQHGVFRGVDILAESLRVVAEDPIEQGPVVVSWLQPNLQTLAMVHPSLTSGLFDQVYENRGQYLSVTSSDGEEIEFTPRSLMGMLTRPDATTITLIQLLEDNSAVNFVVRGEDFMKGRVELPSNFVHGKPIHARVDRESFGQNVEVVGVEEIPVAASPYPIVDITTSIDCRPVTSMVSTNVRDEGALIL